MDVCIVGAGLMGSAICYDLLNIMNRSVLLIDQNVDALHSAQSLCQHPDLQVKKMDIKDTNGIRPLFQKASVVISAVPYFFNEHLTKIAIDTHTHFIDLGGNNTVVEKQKTYHQQAIGNQVTIIPDNGLAPGLVSVITRDIVDTYDQIDSVHLRVGGLPQHPQPPLDYELVFSPNGLINEYLEDAIVLDHGKIEKKPSMTEIESLEFPEPFGTMEAFITSGGCSTVPYTFKDKIQYLDYKTIRYPGHCQRFKVLLDLGFGSTVPIEVNNTTIAPRDVLIHQLQENINRKDGDVVLCKVFAKARKQDTWYEISYDMIDYMDDQTGLTAMMRTTGFPVSITAGFLLDEMISTPGVFCPEEIIPPTPLIKELKKRNISIKKTEHNLSLKGGNNLG